MSEVPPSVDEMERNIAAMSEDQRREFAKEVARRTAKHVFIPNPGPQTQAYFSKADVLLYGGSVGGGKAIEDQYLTPVPIKTDPSGFKKHGDLSVGDFVFSPDGSEVEVIAVSEMYDGAGYEFEFSTGEVIRCSEGHIWNTWSQKERDRKFRSTDEWREARKLKRPSRAVENSKKPWVSKSIAAINADRVYDIVAPTASNKTAKEIAETLQVDAKSFPKNNHSVQVISPISGSDEKLPIDPYWLGLWIGDGTTSRPEITMMASDWKTISHHVYEPDGMAVRDATETRKEIYQPKFRFLLQPLKDLGVLGRKRIPALYRRASFESRVELLRGIMDTDGSCDKRGIMEVGFSDFELATDLFDLVCSLGIKCALRSKEAKDQHGNGNTHYRLDFTSSIPLFKIPRKLERQKLTGFNPTTQQRYIVRATPISGVPMKCITVKNEDGLYCIGAAYITTHNSALGLGLALNDHYRSLVVREHFSDTEGLIDTCKKLANTKEGFVGGTRPKYNKPNGGVIHFAGLAEDGSIGGHQGIDHDYIYVDESANIPEKQIRLLMGWLRTDRKGQRTRFVMGSNPPMDSTGDWMLKFFQPWLDPNYRNKAVAGELRYFIPDDEGNDVECKDGEYTTIAGVRLYAQSRTFIPSKFTDNPYYNPEEYSKTLSALDKSVREILISGNFLFDRPEGLWQLIPRKWVMDAVARWHTHRPANIGMSCMAVDIAQGGGDDSAVARRYDSWFDKMVEVSGKDTPEGKDIAALVVKYRRDNCPVVLDMGGGYGGSAKEQLEANGIKAIGYKGTKSSDKTVKQSKIGFPNIRSEAYWAMREALDPSQPGGSRICLPDDQRLISELCTPEYRYQNNKYKVESKEEVVARLGRSTDYADAVVMCWWAGPRNLSSSHPGQYLASTQKPVPKVILGHNMQRRSPRNK